MTRTRSGQAAKRPVAAAPGASSPLDASILSIVANLSTARAAMSHGYGRKESADPLLLP
jgi:hypothetical protein